MAHVVDSVLAALASSLELARGLEGIAHAYRRVALARPDLYRLAASSPAASERLELPPRRRSCACCGSARRARAAWAFTHGMAELELAGRVATDADVEAAWLSRASTRSDLGAARRQRRGGLVAPAVRDRRPPVAAERLRVQLHAGRGLAALVLGAVDERERPLDHVRVEAVARSAPRASGRARRSALSTRSSAA